MRKSEIGIQKSESRIQNLEEEFYFLISELLTSGS